MSLDSCKTYPRTAPHLLSTTRAPELCLHPSAFPPRMSHHKSLSGKHWLFWHEPGRKRGVISFVFPQEKKKEKVSENKYFCECGAATRKIWVHWERNKDDGFASWRVRMLVCALCKSLSAEFLAATVGALFLFMASFGSSIVYLNRACGIVSSVCYSVLLFAGSLSVCCVCKGCRQSTCWRERPNPAGSIGLQGTTWDCR